MLNIRMKLCIFTINLLIKCLPKEWQSKTALKNLIETNIIEGK